MGNLTKHFIGMVAGFSNLITHDQWRQTLLLIYALSKNPYNTVEPRFSEVPRDRGNLFVIQWNLDLTNFYITKSSV